MNEDRFTELMAEARKHAHTQDDVFHLQQPNARRQLRDILKLLEAMCTPEQWTKVIEAIEQGWP